MKYFDSPNLPLGEQRLLRSRAVLLPGVESCSSTEVGRAPDVEV